MLLIASCNRKENIYLKNSIKASYFNYTFDSHFVVNCDSIDKESKEIINLSFYDENGEYVKINYMGVIDTIVSEHVIMEKIQNELKHLEIDLMNQTVKSLDARISCLITIDSSKYKLCIGGYFADEIEYMGERVRNDYLLYLIKKSIGYYDWIDEETIQYMKEYVKYNNSN